MANAEYAARSNYFSVEDADGFRAAMADYEVTVVEGKRDQEGMFALLAATEDGSWPTHNDERDEDIDMVAAVAPHLVAGQVAVLVMAGWEKLRYVVGFAEAFDRSGESVRVSLDDIYAAAKAKFSVSPTDASY